MESKLLINKINEQNKIKILKLIKGFKINLFVFNVVERIVPYTTKHINETQKKNSGSKTKFLKIKIISF